MTQTVQILKPERKIMKLDEYLKLLRECPAEELEFKVGFWHSHSYILVNANYGKIIGDLESRGYKRLYGKWEVSPGWSGKEKDSPFGGYGNRGFSSVTLDNSNKTNIVVNENVDNFSVCGHFGDTMYQMRNHNITILLTSKTIDIDKSQRTKNMDDMRKVVLDVLDYVQVEKYSFCIPRMLIYSPPRKITKKGVSR